MGESFYISTVYCYTDDFTGANTLLWLFPCRYYPTDYLKFVVLSGDGKSAKESITTANHPIQYCGYSHCFVCIHYLWILKENPLQKNGGEELITKVYSLLHQEERS